MCVSSPINAATRRRAGQYLGGHMTTIIGEPSYKAKTLWPRVAFSAVSQRRFDRSYDQRQD